MQMKWRKTLVVLLLFLIVQPSEAQLDGYKYFVVPLQFDGFKKVNQFRTSTLIKHLFTENGFPVVYDDAIPPELAAKPCQGLRVGLIDQSTLLHTKVVLALKDCYGQTVYETMEGKSKSKDYELAYREAIMEAFVVIAAQGYTYDPTAAQEKDAQAVPVAAGAVTAAQPGLEESPKDTEVASEVAAVGAAHAAGVQDVHDRAGPQHRRARHPRRRRLGAARGQHHALRALLVLEPREGGTAQEPRRARALLPPLRRWEALRSRFP